MKAAKCPLVFILGRPWKRLDTLEPSADPSRLPDFEANPAFFAGAPDAETARSERSESEQDNTSGKMATIFHCGLTHWM